jgi:hypothetical protein
MLFPSTVPSLKRILMASYAAILALMGGLFMVYLLPILANSPECFFGPHVHAVPALCSLNRALTWLLEGVLLFGGPLPIGLLAIAVWLRRRFISVATLIALGVTFVLFTVWGAMSLSTYRFDWMQLLSIGTLPTLHLLLLSLSLRRESLHYLNVL